MSVIITAAICGVVFLVVIGAFAMQTICDSSTCLLEYCPAFRLLQDTLGTDEYNVCHCTIFPTNVTYLQNTTVYFTGRTIYQRVTHNRCGFRRDAAARFQASNSQFQQSASSASHFQHKSQESRRSALGSEIGNNVGEDLWDKHESGLQHHSCEPPAQWVISKEFANTCDDITALTHSAVRMLVGYYTMMTCMICMAGLLLCHLKDLAAKLTFQYAAVMRTCAHCDGENLLETRPAECSGHLELFEADSDKPIWGPTGLSPRPWKEFPKRLDSSLADFAGTLRKLGLQG